MPGILFQAVARTDVIEKVSKQAVGCIQPSSQRVPEMFLPSQNDRRVKLSTHFPLVPKQRLHAVTQPPPARFYGFTFQVHVAVFFDFKTAGREMWRT